MKLLRRIRHVTQKEEKKRNYGLAADVTVHPEARGRGGVTADRCWLSPLPAPPRIVLIIIFIIIIPHFPQHERRGDSELRKKVTVGYTSTCVVGPAPGHAPQPTKLSVPSHKTHSCHSPPHLENILSVYLPRNPLFFLAITYFLARRYFTDKLDFCS